MGSYDYALPNVDAAQKTFIQRVYGWMAVGLALTGAIAWTVANNAQMVRALFQTPGLFIGMIILEFVLVLGLSWGINKLSSAIATSMFLLYAAVNGVTLSVVFLVYTQQSIALTFFVTAATFGGMCVYGMATQRDLTSVGNLCIMALWGMILASIVNFWLKSDAMYWVTTYVGILIFVGLTAYDAQKIKQMHLASVEGSEESRKGAIIGALALYLDFINLFLLLLRLLGRSRD